jgi:hypothetical protein
LVLREAQPSVAARQLAAIATDRVEANSQSTNLTLGPRLADPATSYLAGRLVLA